MKMKKIFISFLALVAIVGVANAQRTWAYDLNSTQEGDAYTFEFKATTAATTANLVLVDVDGNEVAKLPLENVVAGANSVTLELAKLHKDAVNWAVELTGEAIAEMKELTTEENTDFHFWLPQGVAVDNSPESPYFGQIYVASPRSGAMSEGAGKGIEHKAGIYVFDQTLTLQNPTKQQGYVPSNLAAYIDGAGPDGYKLHRIAVDPLTHQVAFTHISTDTVGVWSMNPEDMGAEAQNLIHETGVANAHALCFDESGVLYVLDAFVSGGGTLYKIVDGGASPFAQTGEIANGRSSVCVDGKGGFWIAQYRGQDIGEDANARLLHVNANGEVDYKVDKDTPYDFTGTAQRGAVAYNVKENLLAFGANRYGNLFKVTYDAETGVPSLEDFGKTPEIASNIDGLAFDYAGDLYLLTASIERLYKFAMPTTDNTCTTPAKSSLVITGGTATSIDHVAISVDAQKIIRNGQVLIIRDGKTFNMLGQEVK